MNFSQKDILFHISPSFFVYIYIFSYINSGNIGSEILFAMLTHELGHILVIYLLGKKLSEISMGILGVHIAIHRTHTENPASELAISAAGIAVNLIFAICSIKLSPSLSAANLAVAIYNLIPAQGLDGSRILENLLVCLFGEYLGYTLHGILSKAICILLALAGFLYTIFYEVKFGLLIISIYCVFSVIKDCGANFSR